MDGLSERPGTAATTGDAIARTPSSSARDRNRETAALHSTARTLFTDASTERSTGQPSTSPAAANAAGNMVRYAHRANSILRAEPKASGVILKRELKGATLVVVSQSGDGWSKVMDGNVTGYMRSSALGAEPPKQRAARSSSRRHGWRTGSCPSAPATGSHSCPILPFQKSNWSWLAGMAVSLSPCACAWPACAGAAH